VEILLIVLTVLGLMVLTAVGSVAVLVWMLKRHNRVSPQTPTGAPLVWLCSPSTPARTHRRLRTVAATTRTVPRSPDAPTHSRSALAAELEQQAVALDQWVVWTAHAPQRWRRDHYRAIQAQVRQLEMLAMRLSSLENDRPYGSDANRPSLDQLAEQVDQHEQAHAEIRALERLTLGTAPLPPSPATELPAESATYGAPNRRFDH
jgi:hypothetical protein